VHLNKQAEDRNTAAESLEGNAQVSAEEKRKQKLDYDQFQAEFEASCKEVVDEIQHKFIDLNVEDNNSGYGQDMQAK